VQKVIKVLVVDDHPLFRAGLVAVLGSEEQLEIVGEASDAEEAVQKAERLNPDVILMDIRMPSRGGVEATRAIREKGLPVGILMLTVSDKDDDLFAAIKAGANGYLLKNVEPEELVKAIIHVSRSEAMVSPIMVMRLLTEFSSAAERKGQRSRREGSILTEREREILGKVAQGASNRKIASTLFISENTVKTHIRNIMSKLYLTNRYELVVYAIGSGLVTVEELQGSLLALGD